MSEMAVGHEIKSPAQRIMDAVYALEIRAHKTAGNPRTHSVDERLTICWEDDDGVYTWSISSTPAFLGKEHMYWPVLTVRTEGQSEESYCLTDTGDVWHYAPGEHRPEQGNPGRVTEMVEMIEWVLDFDREYPGLIVIDSPDTQR